MREQYVVLDGVVGSDAQGFSVHRHHQVSGQIATWPASVYGMAPR